MSRSKTYRSVPPRSRFRARARARSSSSRRSAICRSSSTSGLPTLRFAVFRSPSRAPAIPGTLGYELWVDAEQAVELWDALIDVGTPYGITPAGMLALDVARIEAGLLLVEVDYFSSRHALIERQKSSPLELGLGWTVATDKERYNGKAELDAERLRGPSWQFTGLTVDWDSLERLYADVGLPPRLPSQAWRTSVPVYEQGGRRQVGYATSGGWSPLLKRYMALAHLETSSAAPGTAVRMERTVERRRKQATARVTPLPFFNPERKRA